MIVKRSNPAHKYINIYIIEGNLKNKEIVHNTFPLPL